MGLDMYLHRKTYVQNWEHTKPENRHEITIKRGGKVRDDIKPARIAFIVEQVAYWRKANAIHQWMVDNVQGGKDDCGEYYVSSEKLNELADLCREVLRNIELVHDRVCVGTQYSPENPEGEVLSSSAAAIAHAMLPTASGFFFGSTDYDEGCVRGLRQTIEQIEPLLTDDDASYYYHSSW